MEQSVPRRWVRARGQAFVAKRRPLVTISEVTGRGGNRTGHDDDSTTSCRPLLSRAGVSDSPAAAMVLESSPYLENGTSRVRAIQYTSASWTACGHNSIWRCTGDHAAGRVYGIAVGKDQGDDELDARVVQYPVLGRLMDTVGIVSQGKSKTCSYGVPLLWRPPAVSTSVFRVRVATHVRTGHAEKTWTTSHARFAVSGRSDNEQKGEKAIFGMCEPNMAKAGRTATYPRNDKRT